MDAVLGTGEVRFTADASQLLMVSHQAEQGVGKTMVGIDRTVGQLRTRLTAATFAFDGFIRSGGGARGVVTSLGSLASMFGALPGLIAAVAAGGLVTWLAAVKKGADEAKLSMSQLSAATVEAQGRSISSRAGAAGGGGFASRVQSIIDMRKEQASRESEMARLNEIARSDRSQRNNANQQLAEHERRRQGVGLLIEEELRSMRADAASAFKMPGTLAALDSPNSSRDTAGFEKQKQANLELIKEYERMLEILGTLSSSAGQPFLNEIGKSTADLIAQMRELNGLMSMARQRVSGIDRVIKLNEADEKARIDAEQSNFKGRSGIRGGGPGVTPGRAGPSPRGGTMGLTDAFFSIQANALGGPEQKVVKAVEKSDKARAAENAALIAEVKKIDTRARAG